MSDLKKEIFHTSGRVDLTDSENVSNLLWYLEKLENRVKELEEKVEFYQNLAEKPYFNDIGRKYEG